MIHIGAEAEAILTERFGKDTVIALATVDGAVPSVRHVNAYYENGAFYVITHALSGKMRHIKKNPSMAIAGNWFTAHSIGTNLGYVGKTENAVLTEKRKTVFSAWIENGHMDLTDENTVILRVEVPDGLLLSPGTRYAF